LIGQRLGSYEITAKLGEGGMGEVYRATDTKLKRQVAIKVLPAALTADQERLARFEREAQVLAQLHHPNIASIFGLEESEGQRGLVMELVEGPTLAERLEHGSLPVHESLLLARQVAEALEEAHEKGIVHRDLKPQNIKASIEGKVKVLDFGLAKAMDPVGPAASAADLARSPTLMQSPTLTAVHGTQMGVILGTAAYMAPEQAKGLAVDKRADIWAFGVVLYEMLTGARLFSGDSVTDTLADVLRREIDFAALPPETPAAIRRLLRRCLERNPKNRLHDIADARIVLSEAQSVAGPDSEVRPERAAPAGRRAGSGWLAWSIAAGALVAAVLALLSARRPAAPAHAGQVLRTTVLAPPTLRTEPIAGSYALAPDGSAVVVVAPDEAGRPVLWVRELGDPSPRPLTGTEGARLFPFWSHDGREVAYFSDEGLRRVPRGGGASRPICPASEGRGGAWAPDGTILFAPDPYSPLMRVAAAGGTPAAATTLDRDAGELSHRFPTFLPDGRRFLFAVEAGLEGARFRVEAGTLDRLDDRRVLTRSSTAARFAPPRHLVFSREQASLVQELDLDALELVGEPRLLAEHPETATHVLGTPLVELSRTGEMLYAPLDDRPTEFAVLDGEGRSTGPALRQSGQYTLGALARDGRFAALRAEGSGASLWVIDPARASATRLSASGRAHNGAAWSADGREVATFLTSEKRSALVWIEAESGRERELLETGKRWILPVDSTRDGRYLLAAETTASQRRNLVYVRLDGQPAIVPYLESPAEEALGAFSPDGSWLAYSSDVSGRLEAYVDRFPKPAGARRVPLAGTVVGVAWPTAEELIVGVEDGGRVELYAHRVTTAPDLRIGAPRRLLELAADLRGLVAGDDGRFVIARPAGSRPPALTLVQGWARDLEAAR
jgi:Tol biopolymer transport system component